MLGTLLTYINKRDLVHICVVLGTDHYFLGRGGGGGALEIFTGKQTIFVSPSSRKHFLLLADFLLQCLQPLQTIYFITFQPPPPVNKKLIVRLLLNLGMKNWVSESTIFFYTIKQQQTNVLVAGLYYAIPC